MTRLSDPPAPTPTPSWPSLMLVGWLALATAAGISGLVASLRPPFPQLLIAGLTLLLILIGRSSAGFKRWLEERTPRQGIALHLTRFVGLAFLWYETLGLLPSSWAVPAAVGDVFVATLALGLLLTPTSQGWVGLARLWNVIGLADILFVVVTAARIGLADPDTMQTLWQFPLSLVPTFLVPLIIASHVWLFGRLRTSPHRPPSHAALL